MGGKTLSGVHPLVNRPPVVKRGTRHIYIGWLVSIGILLTVNCLWANSFQQIVAISVVPNAVLIVSQIIWRLCLLSEECSHVQKLCCGSYRQLFERTLCFNKISTCTAFTTFAFLFSDRLNLSETWKDIGPIPFSLSFCSYYILHCIMQSEVCPAWEDHIMKQLNGLDYGSGMAHSFFHGYLKIILPARGDSSQGISERIKLFLEKEEIREDQFPIQKLIVLIPSSGNLFPLLTDEPSQVGADPAVTASTELRLQDVLRNRAGTQQRVYRGAAYRIRVKRNGTVSFLYTIAEGATAVLTFREACLAGSPEAEHLRMHKADVISNFYRTLQKLIDDDKQLTHLVDLLYYDDEDPTHADVLSLLTEHLLEARHRKYNF
ncbi:hypothetical protein FOCC_FOCC013545 [Frankliniella occidentalis]|uniref:Stimulator of interferon genes protein homolog n=1 Tax=Frankliniella occidentalis TaxID=133901 RepID=A0A6J1SMP7_FRAOC|nr:stimulator of interferon genes protein homolog [Frankliniella occidentalis]KAE8740933.1 hypothetical protein FOCC_FOCC013545 [Frankliniella occidentalis]